MKKYFRQLFVLLLIPSLSHAESITCKSFDTGTPIPITNLSKNIPSIKEISLPTGNPHGQLVIKIINAEAIQEHLRELTSTPLNQESINSAQVSILLPYQQSNNAYLSSSGRQQNINKLLLLVASSGALMQLIGWHEAAIFTSLIVAGFTVNFKGTTPFLTSKAILAIMIDVQVLNTFIGQFACEALARITYTEQQGFTLPEEIKVITKDQILYLQRFEQLDNHFLEVSQKYTELVTDFQKNVLPDFKNDVLKGDISELRHAFIIHYENKINEKRNSLPSQEEQYLILTGASSLSLFYSYIRSGMIKSPTFSIAASVLAQAATNALFDYYSEGPWEDSVIPYCIYNSSRNFDSPTNVCSYVKGFFFRKAIPVVTMLMTFKYSFERRVNKPHTK